MRKLFRLILIWLDCSVMFICLFFLLGLLVPLLIVGVIQAVKHACAGLVAIWREDRAIAYAVVASVAWCAGRYKALNKSGPHERVFQSEWPRRVGVAALAGTLGLAMAGCVVALVASLIKTEFRHLDAETVAGTLMCGFLAVVALIKAFRVLSGKDK